MKKFLAVLTASLFIFSIAGAFAETVHFTENSTDFDIEMALPEGATPGAQTSSELVSVCDILSDGLATVHITIAPSDIYNGLSMNDLNEADVENLKAMAVEQYENPEVSIEITPSGNKYVLVRSDAQITSIFTLYLGYFVELTQWHDDYSALTDTDFAFMQQLLYNINFIPVQ